MTLSRQLRHKARADRAAEPYRQARYIDTLEEAHVNGTHVLVAAGMFASVGWPKTIREGEYIEIQWGDHSLDSIPWKKITDVRPAT